MKTVLITDDEKLFLASLTEGLSSHRDEFEVVTANNGKQALGILDSRPIDLLVTDLKMPVMDGFQLLAAMMNKHWAMPVIVMTAFGTPEIEDQLREFNTFGYLEKPIDFLQLAEKIRGGLEHTDNGLIKGITLFSFLQLLAVERKTCSLKVKSVGREAALHFSDGELFDAAYGNLKGELAALEIVCWEDAEIEIVNIFKKLRRTINKPLMNVLMEAAQAKDEAALELESPAESPIFGETDDADEILEPHFAEVLTAADSPTHDNPANNPQPAVAEALLADRRNPDPTTQIQTNSNRKVTVTMANNVNESIEQLMNLDGAMAVALVDRESGMALGQAGNSVNLEVAAAGNSEVIKTKMKVMGNLGLKDRIEDILISLGQQYHLIRPLASQPSLFFYLVLDRSKSNLAMARFKLGEVEKTVTV